MNILQIIQLLTRPGGPIEKAAEKFRDRTEVTEAELLAELNIFADAGARWQAELPPEAPE